MSVLILSNIFIALSIIISVLVCFLAAKANFFTHIDFNSSRILSIDGARGVAASLVVMNHMVFILMNSGIVSDKYFSEIDYYVFTRSGGIGVQIFFCITAFLFTDRIIKKNNNIDWKIFFHSRIKRLAPLYIFMIILSICIALSFSTIPFSWTIGNIYSIVSMFSFGFLGGDVHILGFRMETVTAAIWTLPYEWRFYALLPIASAIIYSKRIIIPSIVFLFLVAFIDSYISSALWVYFISGSLVAIIYSKTRTFNGKLSGILSSLATLAIIIFLMNTEMEAYGQLRLLIITIFFSIIVLFPPTILTMKPLVYLGEISYSSYLMHLPILFVLFRFINKIKSLESISFNMFMIISLTSIIASTIFSCLTFKYIEYRFIKKRSNY